MTPRRRTWIIAGAAVAALAMIVAVFWALGFRALVITSPSMTPTLPVGSLVITHAQQTYTDGEIVSFHMDGRVYTHRVVEVGADGLTTQGDLNGAPDGWRVAPDEVIGTLQVFVPALGWLVTAMPWLLLAGIIVEIIARLRRSDRIWVWSTRVLGGSIAVAIAGLILRPWFRIEMLNWHVQDAGTGVLMHVVNTGLFPMSVGDVRLLPAESAEVLVDHTSGGMFSVTPLPALSPSEIGIVVAACAVPLILALVVARFLAAGGVGPGAGRRATAVLLVLSGGFAAAVPATPSEAAYTASVRNTNDVAGTNIAFTCRTGIVLGGATTTYAAYAMDSAGVTSEPDLTGNNRAGTYAASTAVSSSVGCVRDTPRASVTFNGSNQCLQVPGQFSSPNTISLEAWFSTSRTNSGRIIGFGTSSTPSGTDSSWDRMVYLDNSGRVVFGVYPSSTIRTVASPDGTSYADGKWHHVVATLSSGGQRLYLDGTQVAANTGVTSGQSFDGYFRIGCGSLSSWPNADGSAMSGPSYFTGSLQFSAVYTKALTAEQVNYRYEAGAP